MAQKIQTWLVDDLDGSDAEETVTFALDGYAYEIDLSATNAQKLREMLEPYRRNGRRPGTTNLRAKALPTTGQRTTHFDDSAQIREWAARYELPVNERGRVNSTLRAAYRAFTRNNRGPLRTLLQDANLDPAAADTDGKTIFNEPDLPKPLSIEERNLLAARKAGRLSSAQLTRLRKANAATDGIYVSDGKQGDATSCEALSHRGLFNLIEENVYQITRAGQLWFEAHDVSPDL